MKYSFTKMLPVLFLSACLSGCIKDDRSECNPGVLLKYDYSLNTSHANLFGEEVDAVTVYVFDEQGRYYDCYSENGSRLTNNWQMFLPLPAGNYTTVTWGGTLGTYRTGEKNADETAFQSGLKKGVTHIDDFMLTAEKEDGAALGKLDALYHGKAEVTSVYQPAQATTVELMKNTNRLTVTVEDPSIVPQSARAGEPPYGITCTATNGRYLAGNGFGKNCRQIVNIPHETHVSAGKLVAELDLLRLTTDRPLRLLIKKNDTGKTMLDADLIRLLQATGAYTTQEDLDREDTYDFVYRTSQNGNASITINGWVPVKIDPDL